MDLDVCAGVYACGKVLMYINIEPCGNIDNVHAVHTGETNRLLCLALTICDLFMVPCMYLCM